ncbi:MAG: response regulator transcription factor [Nitrospira sp. BO4]|jgi:two-component system response regulator DegU|nr:response regulator transcription factor [Nitrospira sp. BO4]
MERNPDSDNSSAQSSQPVRVLVVENHRLIRQELRNMVNASGEFTVVGEAENGELACVLAQQVQPHVILMDVSMPRMNGIVATRWIKDTLPKIVIIGLSVYPSAAVAQDMKAAGASAYLTKEASPEELYQAIRAALTV